MNRKYSFFILWVIVIMFLTCPNVLRAMDPFWTVAFESGASTPTDNFSDYVESDRVLGLTFEYMQYQHLGVRLSYETREYNFKYISSQTNNLEMDSYSISAVLSQDFSKYFRIFACIGPAYFVTEGQEYLGLGSDSKDIGWNGGAGFDFYPFKHWGMRLQSLYNSAEIGNKAFRLTWLDTTMGLTFRF